MKLIQLNAWGGRLDKTLLNFLKEQDADLVCLQEIISTNGDAALAISLESLAEKIGYDESFMSPVFSFHLMNKDAKFGNAILSKVPLPKQETVFTNLEFKEHFDFDTDDYNIRNFQHASLEVGGKTLHVLNHHGHHINQHKNGDDQTLRQMKLIADYIKTLEGAVILTGDFNLAPHSESIEILNSMLKNLSMEHKLLTTRTPLTPKDEVCDYIFINDAVKLRSFEASDEIVSDHKALILEFDV